MIYIFVEEDCYDLASKLLKDALEIDPNSIEIKKELQVIEKLNNQKNAAQKQMYGKMFDKLGGFTLINNISYLYRRSL